MFREVVAALLLAACVQAFLSDDIVGSEERNGNRMVGGEIVASRGNQFAFELLIQPKRTTITLQRLQPPACSGVLIGHIVKAADGTDSSSYWALTSARCALSGDTLDVYGGTVKTADATAKVEQAISVSKVIVHEDFLPNMQEYADIALIPLDGKTIVPDDNSITLAKLPTISQTSNRFLLRNVIMAGWGYPNEEYKSNARTLRSVTAFVVPNTYCQVLHLTKGIKDSHICTGGLWNKGPCTGDLGAPLILNSGNDQGTLIGLVTYVPNDGCHKGKPGVFTRITSYLDWIVSITGIDPDIEQ